MKKGYISNVIPQEKQDQAKKLYRFISDNARKLDEARGCATCVSDLFTPILLAQRSKLRESCEKLIFLDPILYGRKGEEMLWRKVYYDIVSTSKRLKKKDYSNEDISHLQCHINAGIGYYHHFISRLEIEHNLNLSSVIDFSVSQITNYDSKNMIPEWVELSIHRCLIYLGDLTRYKLEIYPNWDPNLAIRYYLQAAKFKPEFGMPHNQLGTLSLNLNYSLDSTYHYLRCLDSKFVFEGTENNLRRLFEKNEKIMLSLDPNATDGTDIVKRLITKFLALIDILYFEKKRQNLHQFCHEILLDLQGALNISKPLDSPTENDDNFDIEALISPNYLSSDIVFKITVILLICVVKLESVSADKGASINASNSPYLSIVKALLLALYSQLIQTVVNKVESSVFNVQVSKKKVKNGVNKKKPNLAKLRRSLKSSSQSESDLSESEAYFSENSDSEGSSFSISTPFSSENEDNNDESNENHNLKKSNTKKMDPNDLLEIFADEDLLRSIKILSDYLLEDLNILKTCSNNTSTLQKRITSLLNLINLEKSLKKLKKSFKPHNLKIFSENFKTIPLPEDIILKGLPILKNSQSNLDWDFLNNFIIDQREDMLIRILKMVDFGRTLIEVEEIGICYDKKKMFWVRENSGDEILPSNNLSEDADIHLKEEEGEPMSRGALMKHMGQLWLAAEVQNLESRVQESHNTFSPYLVLDTQALIHYTHVAKQLVAARKFIILIPVTVLSALDELKRETIKARDAIRWLETQFHRGNRFLRAQRAQERSSIPLIKYPKKKDKETYTFIQIIECCHFLTQQQKNSTNLVTLLTGNQSINRINENNRDNFSYTGLAKSAGINIELITTFHARWKKSLKPK